MDKRLRELINKLLENRMRRAVALVLAIIVTFTTTYTLVLPAITLEKDTAETMSGVSLGRNEQGGDTSTSTETEDSDDNGLDESNSNTVAFDAEAKNEDGETETLVHVETDINAFPEGTTMEATVVTDQDMIESIAEATEGEVVAVRAVGLTFTDESGETVQAAEGSQLNVTLSPGEGVSSSAQNEEAAPESAKQLDGSNGEEASADQNTETTVVQYTEDKGAETVETNDDVTFRVEPENDLDQDNAVSFDMGEQSGDQGSQTFALVETVPENDVKSEDLTDAENTTEDAEPETSGDVGTAENEKVAETVEKPLEESPDQAAAEVPVEEQEELVEEPIIEYQEGVLTAQDESSYIITMTYGPEALIPEDAYLQVEEIVEAETYDSHLEETQKVLNEAAQTEQTKEEGIYAGPTTEEPQFFGTRSLMEDPGAFDRQKAEAETAPIAPEPEIVYARFFDITIMDANGKEVTPAVPVKVSIELLDADQDEEVIQNADSAQVVHFGEEKTEVMQAEALEDTVAGVSFDAEGFSVYGVVYTVDFHVGDFSYSIQGGSAVSLSELFVILGMEKDVSDVESVMFSNPDLVWVGKVDTEITVGQLKEDNGLDAQYSAELTEEQIAEINAKTVEAGDWALISVQPFNSEETLTVTMKDGEVFTIRVTDYQISTNILTADGKTYKITVTYDDDAEIPEGTRLVAEEIGQDTDEYMQYAGQTWTEVNREYLEELVSKGPGEYCHLPQMSIDQARFFKITLISGDQEIEPKAPVQVEIRYADGLGIDGIEERIAGVSHFKEDESEPIRNIDSEESAEPAEPTEPIESEGEEGRIEVYFNDVDVELIKDVETSKDKDDRIIGYSYQQNGFSVVGTYIGHQTRDAVMRVPQLRLAAGNGVLETPDPQKHLVPNTDNGVEDGTYTLSLSVTGDSKNSTKVETKKSNVLFVMDRSSSMNRYVRYLGTIDTSSTSYYGSTDNGKTIFPVFYQSGKWQYQRRVGFSYQWVDYDNEQYGFYLDVARLPEEQQALKDLFGQLLGKNTINDSNSDSDNIEIKVISFASKAGNNQGWTGTESGWVDGTNSTVLNNTVNRSSTDSGTNWEEALKYAQSVINAKKETDGPDEDYYVIFLTDGAPTATTAHQSYYYGTEGHSATDLDSKDRPRNSCEPAYEDATDEARALVNAGCKLYNIFTYGTNDDYKYLVRLTNYAYGDSDYIYDNVHDNEEPEDYFPDSANAQKYFTNATDTETLVNAFQNIFSEISVTQSHVQVKITDGLRQDALTSTFVNGKPSGVTYTVAPKDSPNEPIYTVTATVPEDSDEPVVTFKIGNNEYSTAVGQVVKHVKEPVEGDPLASYDAGTYYSVTVGGVEYKMALATVVPTDDPNVSTLTWDLSPVGMLMDDCIYKADFIVWPNQDAYDYVAALNNGLTVIADPNDTTAEPIPVVWNQSGATQKTDSQNRTYYEGGCAQYPSIVYYPDPDKADDPQKQIYYGTFSVLTNTDQKLDYSIVTTEDGKVTSVEPQPQIPMELPDPMPLEDTGTFVLKKWSVERDAGVFAQYLYDLEGNPKKFRIQFDIYQGAVTESSVPYTSVNIGWDNTAGPDGKGAYVWEGPVVEAKYGNNTYTIGTHWKADFDISAGLMLSDARMTELKLDKSSYPSAQFGNTTYYILEPGHDYTIKENGENIGYEFDFVSPVYHPMLVDGVMKNVGITKSGSSYVITGIAPTPLDTLGLEIENKLRAYLHLKKVVLGEDGSPLPNDKTKFEYTIGIHSPIKLVGKEIPWYAINDLFYHDSDFNYYQADPIFEGENQLEGVLTLTTESGYTCVATCEGRFDPDIAGPTTVHYVDEEGEQQEIALYGNMMTSATNQQDMQAVLKINQDERLTVANIPAESTYRITETKAPGYELAGIVADQSATVDGYSINGTIIQNSDNHVTYKNTLKEVALELIKVDNTNMTTPLEDAQFTLKKLDPEGAGTYLTGTDAVEKTSGVTGTDGKASITGITDGYYEISETKTPEGYIIVDSGRFYIKVLNGVISLIDRTEDNPETTDVNEGQVKNWTVLNNPEGNVLFVHTQPAIIDDPATEINEAAQVTTAYKVGNTPGVSLPSTGGPGTNLIYLLGIMFTGIAGTGLVMRKKQKESA